MNAPFRLLVALAALALCTACPSSEPSAADAPAVEGYPRTVATFEGRSLELPRPVRRVAAANAGAVEFLDALGALDRVCALPTTAFTYSSVALDRESFASRSFEKYLPEVVLARAPDLVITHAWQNRETTAVLTDAGIPVLRIPAPTAVADLGETLRVLGSLLELEHEGEEAARELEARAARLASSGEGAWTALTYTSYGTGSWTAARGTTADLVLRLAGLRNLAAEAGLEGHATLDLERLLTLEPDLIVVGADPEDPARSTTLETLRGEQALESLDALRNDRIVVLPAALFSTNSLTIVDAAERLADEARRLMAR